MNPPIPFTNEDVRLAIMEFATGVETELRFEDTTTGNYEALIEQIRKLKSDRLVGTQTNTAKALAEAKSFMDYNERFAV